MPTLHWIGKDKVINHHQDVPFRLLDHQYGALPDGTQTTELTGSGNQIIHGDNLEALKALLLQYEGQVKCIYIDPPYNTTSTQNRKSSWGSPGPKRPATPSATLWCTSAAW
jgi:adenine-specific DNA-methyltransferase